MTNDKEVRRLRAALAEAREIMVLQREEIGRLQKRLAKVRKLAVKTLEEIGEREAD